MPSRAAAMRVAVAASLVAMAAAILLSSACGVEPPPKPPREQWGPPVPKPTQVPDDPEPVPIATGRFGEVVVPAHGPGVLYVLDAGSGKLLWWSPAGPASARPLQAIIPSSEVRRSGLRASTKCQVYLRSAAVR